MTSKVYAIGRIKEKRKLIGYKLLNLSDYSIKNYSITSIQKLLGDGAIIGNLFLDTSGNIEEYFCSDMLPEYNTKEKRIGFSKNVYLTIAFTATAISEIYYSKDELIEIIDLSALQVVDAESYLSLPFMQNSPVDRYIKSYMSIYDKLNEDVSNIDNVQYTLDNLGRLTCKIEHSIRNLKIAYSNALYTLSSSDDKAVIDNLKVDGSCGAILSGAIQDIYIKNVVIDNSIICPVAFKNCRLDTVDLRMANIESRLNAFDNCKIKHLILPRWYDSWEFLDSLPYPIDCVEITNTNCTTSIWETTTKDKLQFKKIMELVLPMDFEYEQEKELHKLLPNLVITRKIN